MLRGQNLFYTIIFVATYREMHSNIVHLPISAWPAIFNSYGLNLDLKKGIIEKNSYERRAYESVDDWSLSCVISQKLTENKTLALMD